MRSASRRVPVLMSAALLVLVVLGSNVQAQSVSVTVDSQFSPNPVRVGNPSVATLSATATPPTPPYDCTLSGPTWTWVQFVAGSAKVDVSGSGSSCTVTADIDTSGIYSDITINAMASWSDSCGNIYSANSDVVLESLTVVAVESITPLSEVQDKNIGDTLTKSDFSITTNPSGYVDLVTVNPVTIQLGDNIVKATCGTSSARTDIIGCECSGSLSDLIIGPSGSDDSMNFTALVQGCAGTYTITGSDSAAVIDGGDTSGSLIADESHSGTVYINATPPSGSNISRLPIFRNVAFDYGLGGMPGYTEMKQVNGQSEYASGLVQNTVTASTGGGAMVVGIVGWLFIVRVQWWNPGISAPGGGPTAISTTTTLNYNPKQISSWYTVTAAGKARTSSGNYKYTLDPSMIVFVNNPSSGTTTDLATGTVYNVWEYAQANLAGQAGTWEQKRFAFNVTGSDKADGKTQIKTGAGNAQLWVSTLNNANRIDVDWRPPNGTVTKRKITVTWY